MGKLKKPEIGSIRVYIDGGIIYEVFEYLENWNEVSVKILSHSKNDKSVGTFQRWQVDKHFLGDVPVTPLLEALC